MDAAERGVVAMGAGEGASKPLSHVCDTTIGEEVQDW